MSTVQGVQEDLSELDLQGMANMDMALLLNYKYCKILVVWVIFEVMFFIFLCKQAMLHQIFGLLCGESVVVRVVLHVTLQIMFDVQPHQILRQGQFSVRSMTSHHKQRAWAYQGRNVPILEVNIRRVS
jgi:hypothetical protein